jgi:hypothetical protein
MESPAPTVPDFDLTRGQVESRAHHTLAMQGMVARGTLPLVEITGIGAHRPNEQLNRTLKTGEKVHADFDASGRLSAVDVDNGRGEIEHVDFDEHGRITRDAVHGPRMNSAVFQYDANGQVRDATISTPRVMSAFALDGNGNVLFSRWQTEEGIVDQFTNSGATRAISSLNQEGVATTFNYDLHNQFQEGEVVHDRRITVIGPGPDGAPKVTGQGRLI